MISSIFLGWSDIVEPILYFIHLKVFNINSSVVGGNLVESMFFSSFEHSFTYFFVPFYVSYYF